jgi:hypothetical protein
MPAASRTSAGARPRCGLLMADSFVACRPAPLAFGNVVIGASSSASTTVTTRRR